MMAVDVALLVAFVIVFPVIIYGLVTIVARMMND